MRSRQRLYLSREQLENILSNVGVKVVSETSRDLLCYCPFHHNVDSPAFNIEKKAPYRWKCWNGKCDKKGNVFSLLTQKGYSTNEARKMLFTGVASIDDFEELMRDLLGEDEEEVNPWVGFDADSFAREDVESNYRGRNYLLGRGITEEAYGAFKMGYSAKKDMAIIPVFDDSNTMLGVIGRSIEGKQYRYSAGLQRGSTIFNINKAIHAPSREIILTEGSLDSVYIWQAGYECVGAVLGSAISPDQWKLLRKYFTDIICFFDNDDAGIALTESVIRNAHGMGVSIVDYPEGVKDPGDLSPESIKEMIDGRVESISILLGEL